MSCQRLGEADTKRGKGKRAPWRREITIVEVSENGGSVGMGNEGEIEVVESGERD